MTHRSTELRPMKDFDPTKPALLNDVLTGRMVTWNWERAEDFRRFALVQPDGRVLFECQLFDGWDEVLGG
jgi:hypothetical protein